MASIDGIRTIFLREEYHTMDTDDKGPNIAVLLSPGER